MDNRYRNQNNRYQSGDYDRQQQQFDSMSGRQFGDDQYGTNERDFGRSYQQNQQSDYNRGYRGGGDRYSQESSFNGLNDYDQQSQSFGRSGYGNRSHSYFRPDDYGGSNMTGPQQTYAGYGSYNRDSYSGGYGYGRDNDRSYRSRDDRGFFDRMGDKIEGWFSDDDDRRYGRDRDSYRRYDNDRYSSTFRDRYDNDDDHYGRGPTNYKRSDERILEDACDRITHDSRVDGRNIEVTVQNGEVTLDGTVDSRMAKRRAEDCVDHVSGVGHVQNNLRVDDNDRYDSTRGTSGNRIGDLDESRSVKRDPDATNKALGKSGTKTT